MKLYLISDNIDTQVGMRLAGIDGVVLHDPKAIMEAVRKTAEDEEIGVVLITEKAADMVKDDIRAFRMSMHRPLIVEIPDRHGSRDIAGSINSMVEESIGLKL